jgi:Domain of unknown function (DUF5667)
MKRIILIVFIIIISSIFLLHIVSQNALPNWLGFYEIKRLEEKIFLSLQSTDAQRVEYLTLLLDKRLEELQSVVKNRNYDTYYQSNLRYGTQAGQLTEFILSKNLENQRKATLIHFRKHEQEISNLLKQEDQQENSKFIRDSLNYLAIYSAKLSK